MTTAEFRQYAKEWIHQNPGALFETIPAGSGVCRIVNCAWDGYHPGYISATPGRWTPDATGYRYFASDLSICEAELGYYTDAMPPDRVVELGVTSREIIATSILRLPAYLQAALFEDRGMPSLKWQKPHVFMELLRAEEEYRGSDFVLAPSASGIICNIAGTCLVGPASDAVRIYRSLRHDTWMAE